MSVRFTSDRYGNIYPIDQAEKLKQLKASDPKYRLHTRGEIYRELVAQSYEKANGGKAPTAEELSEYIYSVSKWEKDLFAVVDA